jgi:tetratricopeptide (TPR) repeat protein
MKIFSERSRRCLSWVFYILVLAYAFLTGLRTVADFDFGWLLAMGRQLVTHHQIPRTDFLSYTASGSPWIYPSFGGALFYLAYAAGGFAALSWINALACLGVTAIAIGRPRFFTCALAVLAVPSIVVRTAPRGDLFTNLFFAMFLVLLRKHWRDGRAPLWLLPVTMLFWVNAHPGFAAGLALLFAYAAFELAACCSRARRPAARTRLRAAVPWIALSVVATLVNPWGARVYQGLAAQNRISALQSAEVGEWSSVHLSAATLAGALQLRDPNSSYWWLLAFACVAVPVALYRRQFGHALLLAGAAYLSLEHLRFQSLFAIVAVVMADQIFSRRPAESGASPLRFVYASGVVVTIVLALLHTADCITDRAYLGYGELSLFGTGLSWWYPQRAMDFIEKNSLPPQLFNDFATGGYLTFRLGPRYRDFADGRAVPFPPEVLTQQATLVRSSPDSPVWKQEADRRGINTILLSLARYGGLESVPLREYCESREWKPVYLDDLSLVLLRDRPENQPWIRRFELDCTRHFIVPPRFDPASTRGRAELYNFYANAASIYFLLGRDHDAADAIVRADNLFDDDPNLHLLAGQFLQANGRLAEAEAEYRRALRLRPSDMGWYLLARLFVAQKNYAEAATAVRHSADMAVWPAERYRLLGNIELAMNQPRAALAAFDRAEQTGLKQAALPTYGDFRAKVAEGRARAWLSLHDNSRATAFAEESTRLAPDPRRWSLLGECYAAQGRSAEAEQARSHAQETTH